jgi:D-beta-D-heptose 7-phosphate kinase / D-beta-D-heptose 1-phosphate adenosyltransferase
MTHSNPKFESATVLIVGDVMLDRYWHGDSTRISPEAPVPVVHVQRTENRPGGAANVAVNVAALGAQAILIGVVGTDSAADELRTTLGNHRVRSEFVVNPRAPTICKMRVISRHQQLIRLDTEEPESALLCAHEVCERAISLLPDIDILVLSDYAKGALGEARALIERAKACGIRVLVDPKGNDFERYRGAFCVTPNRSEFEAVVGRCADTQAIEARGEELRSQLNLSHLLVTRGEDGMTLLGRGGAQHEPARAREVFDVTGAGDTVIGVFAASLAAGDPVEMAMQRANTAAGIVVGRLGTASVSAPELLSVGQPSVAPAIERGVCDMAELIAKIRAAQATGETVVMTNGCFDLLHAGHLDSLEQARAFGDRLVVALNDDASVTRLKGASRPIVPLAQRAALVAALRPVDWVVSFADDTPELLICEALPDVLVKGGDYAIEDIAGANCVRANGGSVVTLKLIDGLSTTKLIASSGAQAVSEYDSDETAP